MMARCQSQILSLALEAESLLDRTLFRQWGRKHERQLRLLIN